MGDAEKGRKTILNYHQVWEQFGATPEFYSLSKLIPTKGREGYPLRPGNDLMNIPAASPDFGVGVFQNF